MEAVTVRKRQARGAPQPATPTLATSSWGVELCGGALAGLVVCAAFYPLESVEARMQVGQLGRGSLIGLIRGVGRAEGAKGLYRGLAPTATGATINWALYFALYHHVRTSLREATAPRVQPLPSELATKQRPAMGVDLLAATVGGAVCALVVNPFWVLKLHRITGTASAPASMLASARHIISTQGYRGLWRGTLISMLGVIDGGLQLSSYDQIKYRLSDERNVLPVWGQLFAGASSRVLALVATYPYQLLRSVLQQQNSPYTGVFHATRHIVSTEGVKGLYKGIGFNIARSVPPAAFMFLILEQFRLMLNPPPPPSV